MVRWHQRGAASAATLLFCLGVCQHKSQASANYANPELSFNESQSAIPHRLLASGSSTIVQHPMRDEGAFLSVRQLTPGPSSTEWDKLWIPPAQDLRNQTAISFASYLYDLSPGGILLSRAFSGAGCISYSFLTLSCTQASPVVAYLADADAFLQNYYENRHPVYSSLIQPVPGRLSSSICINSTAGCAQQMVSLSGSNSYNLVIANGGKGQCSIVSRYTVIDAGATECAGLPSPETAVGAASVAADAKLPLGLSPGMATVDYTQPSGSAEAAQYRVAMAFLNTTCLQFSLNLKDTTADQAPLYSAALIALPDYLQALTEPDTNMTADEPSLGDVMPNYTDSAMLQVAVIAGCTSVQCNATNGTWMRVTGLQPGTRYLLIRTTGPEPERVYVAMQAYSADQCAAYLPQTEPVFGTWPLADEGKVQRLPSAAIVSRHDTASGVVYQKPGLSPVIASGAGDVQPAAGVPLQDPHHHTIALVGGILGSLLGVALAVIAALLTLLLRQRQDRREPPGVSTIMKSIERKKVQGPAPPDSPAVTLRNGYLKQYSVPGSPASPCSLAPTDVMASLHMHASQDMPIAELDSRDTLSSRSHAASDGGAHTPSDPAFHSGASGLSAKLKVWKINPDSIKLSRDANGAPIKLGHGGQVYKGVQDEVREVAAKCTPISHADMPVQEFWAGIQFIADLRDKSIVQFYGAVLGQEGTMLVYEYMEGGSLDAAITVRAEAGSHQSSRLAWHRRGRHVALDIAHGLFFLHSRQPAVAHGNLSSANVLLTQEGTAKLANVGQPGWLADSPASSGGFFEEASQAAVSAAAADILEFGIILHQILTGGKPDAAGLKTQKFVTKPGYVPEAVIAMMQACLCPQASQRPSAKIIVSILQVAGNAM